MRNLVLFFALSFIADAQPKSPNVPVSGLPQYNITLTGSKLQLYINNGSTKAIAGIVLGLTDSTDGKMYGCKGLLAPGMILPDGVTHPFNIPLPNIDLIAAITIDAVVFEDGTYVGPDVSGSFNDMASFVADSAAPASPLVSAATPTDLDAAWNMVNTTADKAPGEGPYGQNATAKILRGIRSDKGDEAAINAARLFAKLSPLTRGK